MAALQRAIRHSGQKPQRADPSAEAAPDLGGQRLIGRSGALIEDDAADAAVLPKAQKPLNDGKHRKRRPPGVDHQNGGGLGNVGHRKGAGPGIRQAHSVVIAHAALNNAHVAACAVFRQQKAGCIVFQKKQVQIGALRADDPAVEHGVDVIRPALEGAGLQAPVVKRLQNGAGDGGLSAAAARPGQQHPWMVCFHKAPLFPPVCRDGKKTAAAMAAAAVFPQRSVPLHASWSGRSFKQVF